MPYHPAEVIFGETKRQPCFLAGIRFDNVSKTKKEALFKETAELFKSNNLDDLVTKAHMAAQHMEVSICGPFYRKFALRDASTSSECFDFRTSVLLNDVRR